MGARIVVPQDILDDILKDYESGQSVLALSRKYANYKYDKIYSLIKESGVKIRSNKYTARKYHCNSNTFNKIDTEEKAYWLGFIYADGYISLNGGEGSKMLGIAISDKDKEHLVKFKRFMNSTSPIYTYDTSKTSFGDFKFSRIVIRDNELCNDLINLGVTMSKTNILKFPHDIIPKGNMKDFIRGYFDGDGSLSFYLSKSKNFNEYKVKWCGTEEMLTSIHSYLPTNRVKMPALYVRNKDSLAGNFQVDYGGNIQVGRILDYMYEGSTVYLDRKFERYQKYIEEIRQ